MKTLLILLSFWAWAALGLHAQKSNEQKIAEVYGLQFFDGRPELKAQFLRLLSERIRYQQEPQSENDKLPKLSALGLRNKMNPTLQADAGFDAATFNPLKYNIDLFSDKIQVYRIDNSDYLLIVEPQTR